jgi:hypothetical protein
VIKVSVLDPYAEGMRFDRGSYRDKHLPLAKARLGHALKACTCSSA